MSYPRYVGTDVDKWIDTDINAVVDHVLAGETVSGFIAGPYTYIIREITGVYDAVDSDGTRVYGGPDDEGGVDGDDCSAVTQAVIDSCYSTGALIVFSIGDFTFNTQVTIPDGTYGLRFKGSMGWTASANRKGTYFESTIAGDALFQQEFTTNYRASFGLEFENIIFGGDESAGSSALHLTNSTTGSINHCMFFGFDHHIIIDMDHDAIVEGGGGNYDLIVAEMPGLFTIHDNVFSEHQTAAVKLDNVTQVKLHDNEFEDWGPFLRQVHIINSNGIHICDNRFTGNDGTAQQLEVIKIDTDETIYCNQIQISSNIAYMGDGTAIFPFIEMTNTFGTPHVCNNIISRDNNLVLDYTPSVAQILANDMYELPATPATLGGIEAQDHIRTLNDTENFKDFTVSLVDNTAYQNLWSPLHLYFVFTNVAKDTGAALYLGKTSAGLTVVDRYYNNTGAAGNDVIGLQVDVPFGWFFKYVKTGACTFDSCYGVYH